MPPSAAATAEELEWLQQLGMAAAPVCRKGSGHEKEQQGHHLSPFELADVLEQGFGPGLSSRFTDPPGERDEERRMLVHRAPNRRSYLLATREGEPLLLARMDKEGTRFDFFPVNDGEPACAAGPSFVLEGNETRSAWKLHSGMCQRCQLHGRDCGGRRLLARVVHYRDVVGPQKALCMDVDLPPVATDGSCSAPCPNCFDVSVARTMVRLTTRRPRWNQVRQCLSMDFRGKVARSSSKNYQLEPAKETGEQGKSPKREVKPAKCCFGKVDDNKFVLDFCNPLSPIQAFGAALSASHWK